MTMKIVFIKCYELMYFVSLLKSLSDKNLLNKIICIKYIASLSFICSSLYRSPFVRKHTLILFFCNIAFLFLVPSSFTINVMLCKATSYVLWFCINHVAYFRGDLFVCKKRIVQIIIIILFRQFLVFCVHCQCLSLDYHL